MKESFYCHLDEMCLLSFFASSLGCRGLPCVIVPCPGPEVIKLEFILKLKIKRTDWLLADTCPQVANHCALV